MALDTKGGMMIPLAAEYSIIIHFFFFFCITVILIVVICFSNNSSFIRAQFNRITKEPSGEIDFFSWTIVNEILYEVP